MGEVPSRSLWLERVVVFPGAFSEGSCEGHQVVLDDMMMMCPSAHFPLCFLSQILTTVRATLVKMVALASMVLTPTSVSAVTAGRGPSVKPVSCCCLGGQMAPG